MQPFEQIFILRHLHSLFFLFASTQRCSCLGKKALCRTLGPQCVLLRLVVEISEEGIFVETIFVDDVKKLYR